ncbi:Putative Eukaryotic translation initiation factor 3 subunit E [Rhizopus microsporus]|nr:Putative Eukaryotic translation initiation factor 3 subunit E [Rhizopus microsporus]
MAATHDLTMKMIPFLDRHLVFPLIEFLELKEVYVAEDLLKAKYDLFKNSNMVDFVVDLYKKLNKTEETPKEFAEKRESVLARMEDLRTKAQKVMEVLQKPEVIAVLRQDKAESIQYLKDNYQFTDDSINILYEFGQFQYNCGDYGGAADYLYHYRVLSSDPERSLSATWGKMAAEILTGNWDGALEEIQKLREAIDQKSFVSPLQQLQQPTVILAIMGIPWAIVLWIPFSLVGEYVSYEDEQRQKKLPTTTSEHQQQDDFDAGMILGVHNMYIVFPQFAVAIISSIIFAIASDSKTSGESNVAIVLAFGGLMALIAAVFSRFIKRVK